MSQLAHLSKSLAGQKRKGEDDKAAESSTKKQSLSKSVMFNFLTTPNGYKCARCLEVIPSVDGNDNILDKLKKHVESEIEILIDYRSIDSLENLTDKKKLEQKSKKMIKESVAKKAAEEEVSIKTTPKLDPDDMSVWWKPKDHAMFPAEGQSPAWETREEAIRKSQSVHVKWVFMRGLKISFKKDGKTKYTKFNITKPSENDVCKSFELATTIRLITDFARVPMLPKPKFKEALLKGRVRSIVINSYQDPSTAQNCLDFLPHPKDLPFLETFGYCGDIHCFEVEEELSLLKIFNAIDQDVGEIDEELFEEIVENKYLTYICFKNEEFINYEKYLDEWKNNSRDITAWIINIKGKTSAETDTRILERTLDNGDVEQLQVSCRVTAESTKVKIMSITNYDIENYDLYTRTDNDNDDDDSDDDDNEWTLSENNPYKSEQENLSRWWLPHHYEKFPVDGQNPAWETHKEAIRHSEDVHVEWVFMGALKISFVKNRENKFTLFEMMNPSENDVCKSFELATTIRLIPDSARIPMLPKPKFKEAILKSRVRSIVIKSYRNTKTIQNCLDFLPDPKDLPFLKIFGYCGNVNCFIETPDPCFLTKFNAIKDYYGETDEELFENIVENKNVTDIRLPKAKYVPYEKYLDEWKNNSRDITAWIINIEGETSAENDKRILARTLDNGDVEQLRVSCRVTQESTEIKIMLITNCDIKNYDRYMRVGMDDRNGAEN